MIIRNLCTSGPAQPLRRPGANAWIVTGIRDAAGVSPLVAQTITATCAVPSPTRLERRRGSELTARMFDTGVKTSTVTNQDGAYNIQFLPIGTYTVSATGAGFETSTVSPFVLQIDQIAKIDIKLKVGSVSTTVDVTSDTLLNCKPRALRWNFDQRY